MKKTISWILCVLILLGLVGCSSDKTSVGNTAANGDYLLKEESTQSNATALPENRKLIQKVTMSVETENLDQVLQQINDRIAQLGGYVENSNIQNGSAYSGKRYRSATVTVRIPADDLDAFLDKVGEVTNIVSSQKTVEDVTLSYVATESRMKALQAEESRLLELMEKAASLSELLTIEKRLTEVRTELEQVTSTLKVYDNQVDYATIRLTIQEVKEFTDTTEPETVWERISVGFEESLKAIGNFFVELFVVVVIALPYLVLLAVIPVTILIIVKAKKRKAAKKVQDQSQDDT